MSEEEKLEYLCGVEKWTEETYPRLAALDDCWKECDVKDFDEGLRLASAFVKARYFISRVQVYDSKQRLKKLNNFLRKVREESGMSKVMTRKANDKRRYMAFVPDEGKPDENGSTKEKKTYTPPELDGRRPEHIKEYLHLLPEDLRREAAEVDQLYLRLAMLRQQAEILSTDPRATKEMLSKAAKKVTDHEDKMLNLFERIDLAYQKATGKPMDEERMAELSRQAAAFKHEEKSLGEYTKAEIDGMPEGEQKDACKMARIEANKKYIRRMDVQVTEERKAEIQLRVNELAEWGVKLSKRSAELCRAKGIDVPSPKTKKEEDGVLFDGGQGEEQA